MWRGAVIVAHARDGVCHVAMSDEELGDVHAGWLLRYEGAFDLVFCSRPVALAAARATAVLVISATDRACLLAGGVVTYPRSAPEIADRAPLPEVRVWRGGNWEHLAWRRRSSGRLEHALLCPSSVSRC